MKKFIVHLVETPTYNNRTVDVYASYWYIDVAGVLIFMVVNPDGLFRSEEKVGAFGPRQWEQVTS